MTIVENTETRLVLEWRPWWQTLGWLAFAMVFTHLAAPELPRAFGDSWWLGAATCGLILLLWHKVYRVGQYSCLTLDRTTGRAHVWVRSLTGERAFDVPLQEIEGVWVHFIPGPFALFALILVRKGPQGRTNVTVPRAHQTAGSRLHDAADMISDWLDVPLKTP